MSTTTTPRSGGEWLQSWDPENEETWDKALAWKTLWITTFSLTMCFVAWFLPSAIIRRVWRSRSLSSGPWVWACRCTWVARLVTSSGGSTFSPRAQRCSTVSSAVSAAEPITTITRSASGAPT